MRLEGENSRDALNPPEHETQALQTPTYSAHHDPLLG